MCSGPRDFTSIETTLPASCRKNASVSRDVSAGLAGGSTQRRVVEAEFISHRALADHRPQFDNQAIFENRALLGIVFRLFQAGRAKHEVAPNCLLRLHKWAIGYRIRLCRND